MRLPRFVPILSAFTTRVAACDLTRLLQSPVALARALADTQTVIGHDGVLCFFDVSILASGCVLTQLATGCRSDANEPGLRPSSEVLNAVPLATLFESMQALRHLLPADALIIAAFAGPGSLYRQLKEALEPGGKSSEVDPGYVADVVRNVVRSALEQKADGIALIEQSTATMPAELLRSYKTTRKLADFYDAGFMLFRMPGHDEQQPETHAHCVFDLPNQVDDIGLVTGKLESTSGSSFVPVTTTGDVPGTGTVEQIKTLLKKR